MTTELTHPGQILRTSNAYWHSSLIHTAVNLDLFTVIGDRALSGSEIADAASCDERAVTTLLNAVVALGLLKKSDNKFSNTELSSSSLVRTSRRYIGHMIQHHGHLARAWVKLEESVKSGKSVRGRSSGATGDTQEAFLCGMHVQAMAIAPQMVGQIDLQGRQTLLDLGGGPGTWAIHFALANPGLQATIFDLPGSRPFAEQTIAQFKASDQVSFHGGDFTTDAFPQGFDAAWLSHILHGEDPSSCSEILRKAVDALHDGGLLFIHEFILDDDGTSPVFPAIFSLNMLLVTQGGRSYTRAELDGLLREAGIQETKLLDFVGPTQSRILVGTK
jgi:SAM-dependent methyltransferase